MDQDKNQGPGPEGAHRVPTPKRQDRKSVEYEYEYCNCHISFPPRDDFLVNRGSSDVISSHGQGRRDVFPHKHVPRVTILIASVGKFVLVCKSIETIGLPGGCSL